MGPKGYILWNDAIYGYPGYWLNFNNYLSKDCFMVTNLSIWTVEIFSLI